MTESKISPELNMALGVSEEEREKSLNLNVGYSEEYDEWELIIRYTGSLSQVIEELGISVEKLMGGYGIVRIPQYLIGRLSDYPQIDYIEKPKSLILEQMEGIGASCVNRVRLPDYDLTGRGTLVACLDSGVDFYHRDFRNADGTTRIVAMWDQTVPGNPPEGFSTGSEYGRAQINEALAAEGDVNRRRELVPEFMPTGNSCFILEIAAQYR